MDELYELYKQKPHFSMGSDIMRQLGDISDAGFGTEEQMNAFYRSCKKCDDEDRKQEARDFD